MANESIVQKSPSNKVRAVTHQNQGNPIREEKAQALLDGYLSVLRYFNSLTAKPNSLELYFVRRRLKKLIQLEFRLYKSFPTLANKVNGASSTSVVSSRLQNRIAQTSSSVMDKVKSLSNKDILGEKFNEGLYTFRISRKRPIRRLKKSANQFMLRRRVRV